MDVRQAKRGGVEMSHFEISLDTNIPIENRHQDSGKSCLAYHIGRGQCILCSKCGEFITVADMMNECVTPKSEGKS